LGAGGGVDACRRHPPSGDEDDDMEFAQTLIEIFFHIDEHLNHWAGVLGPWLYVLLFLIIFCETGLVVTPFLPGDSLLFAIGALAARPGSPIELPLAAILLVVAAIGGDAVNYSIGHFFGPKVFHYERSRLLNKRHLEQAHGFYERHGGKTIFLARFIPIIRTFAPFVAGIGRMSYPRFAMYNATGGAAWVLLFLLSGYYFADLPIVKTRFHYVILAIVLISVVPVFVEWFRARRAQR
jgi:membrane-associated protein